MAGLLPVPRQSWGALGCPGRAEGRAPELTRGISAAILLQDEGLPRETGLEGRGAVPTRQGRENENNPLGETRVGTGVQGGGALKEGSPPGVPRAADRRGERVPALRGRGGVQP